MHLLSRRRELLRLLLARQALQPPRLLLGLLSQFALRTPAAARCLTPHPLTHRLGLSLEALVLLLLPTGQLPQPLQCLVNLARLRRCRLLLDGLVLITHPIGLEFKEIREVLRSLLLPTTAATTATLPALQLYFAIRRIGTLHQRQCPFLRWKCGAPCAFAELLLGSLHRGRRGIERRLNHRQG